MPDTEEPVSYEERFKFLFPARPFCALHGPDLVELRWQCWDFQRKKTIGWGLTAEACVDEAIRRTARGEQPVQSPQSQKPETDGAE